MIPNYKKIENKKQLDDLLNYCISWVNHYVSYHQINGYVLTATELSLLKDKLKSRGYYTIDCLNSHNVPCFWIRKITN